MIPGDLGIELDAVLSSAVSAGELLAAAAGMRAAGSWRPAPAGAGGSPGTYASSLAFGLPRCARHGPAQVAAILAGRLRAAAGISAVSVTGGGYLTITVTGAALTSLAARVVAAGPDCAASDALRGTELPAPGRHPELAAAASWQQAWQWLAEEVSDRLAECAGARRTPTMDAKRAPPPGPGSAPGHSPVAAAIAFAGADAVRYALARTAAGGAAATGADVPVSRGLDSALGTVLVAHADAASTLRWAADLRLQRAEVNWSGPGLLGHPRERDLLAAISWLPERVAGAARRRQPRELAAFLEYLAGAWLDCRESCPALPFGGLAAPRDEAAASARLWLADAARTALATGLSLLGVAAPQRI